MAFHHGTIRKYTAALLDFFNGLEIQYNDKAGNTIIRSVPIVYSSREKSRILDNYTHEQLLAGNINVLPKANISLSTMVKSEQRVTNKNIKIATKTNTDTMEYMYNSIPYEFTYELAVMCRGMNEATQIIEQLAPKFNPTVNIDIWEAHNLNEPTRVPVRLLDIGIEQEEYEDMSSNLVTVSIGLGIIGNLYPPIKTLQKIKEFKMNINETEPNGEFYSKRIIRDWDVDDGGSIIPPGTSTQIEPGTKYPPVIIDIIPTDPLTVAGPNNLTVIWNDPDNIASEMIFDWVLLQGTGTLIGDLDTATLDLTIGGNIEIQCTITDPYGNFATLIKPLIATPVVLPSIVMTSHSSGAGIDLFGTAVLNGTYDSTDSTVQSLTGRWVTDNITFGITDLGSGTWESTGLSGGDPTAVAQDLEFTINTVDGDSVTETYTGITPNVAPPVTYAWKQIWTDWDSGGQGTFTLNNSGSVYYHGTDVPQIYGSIDVPNGETVTVFTATCPTSGLGGAGLVFDFVNDTITGNDGWNLALGFTPAWQGGGNDSAQWSIDADIYAFASPETITFHVELSDGTIDDIVLSSINFIEWF